MDGQEIIPITVRRFGVSGAGVPVAGVALLGYLIIFVLLYQPTRDLRSFVYIGRTFVTQSNASTAVRADAGYRYTTVGYDGQFAYFIALDPLKARYYMDEPSYRYTRILYPLLARLLSGGEPGLVPAAMVLINIAAVVAGTWALASWCALRGLCPWYALVYSFYVGQVMAFSRDLTEVGAYALVALGIYLIERWPERWGWSALAFALAALARESTAIFPLLYAVHMGIRDRGVELRAERGRRAIAFGAVALGPALLWQAFLWHWLGHSDLASTQAMTPVPFAGPAHLYPFDAGVREAIEAVLIPAMICLAAVCWSLRRDRAIARRVETWALVGNIVVFVVLLPEASWVELMATGRVTMGVVLAAITVLPWLSQRTWFAVCAGLWLAPSVTFLANPALALVHRV